MEDVERDDVPMLSETGQESVEFIDSRLQTFLSRTRSASLSIPPTESHERETSLVGHTGPLRSERKTPFVQMSGPLYINRQPQNLFQRNQSVTGQQAPEAVVQKFPSFSEVQQNGWPDNNNAGRNEHLQRSGQLGMCNDPYCTTCPIYYNFKATGQKNRKASGPFDSKIHNYLYGDAKCWARRIFSYLHPYVFGVMNPHTKFVQRWNKFFIISYSMAIFLDPMFFFLISVRRDFNCIVINWTWTMVFVVLRSLFDFIFLLNMLLQFRMAYVAPESRVVGAGELVDQPKKIVRKYLCGYFILDLPAVLPLPQIAILLGVRMFLWPFGTNSTKNLVQAAILIQYTLRLYKFLPSIGGQSSSAFVFESARANFVINLLTFVLFGHIVGSCWYLFGLQRVDECLQEACQAYNITSCEELIDCGFELNLMYRSESSWTANEKATNCFSPDDSYYGIYLRTVNLTTEHNEITRYVYSLFWGFQQISTLAGNQTPSYRIKEVLFTMTIIGVGLLLFALLIGNIQNFLQALVRRRLEMSLRSRDVEQWMNHRRLPEELKRLRSEIISNLNDHVFLSHSNNEALWQVREAERYNWVATRGVNEGRLLEDLPEDLQKDIRCHLFKFVKKVRIFALIDEPILDAICERLRQKIYIKGSKILYPGGLVEKMVFIVRGKMESIGEDRNIVPLSEGDACGEELLSWCLEHSSVNRDVRKRRILGQRLISNRMVRCLTNVEAFSLQAADLEEVTRRFSRFLRNPRVQGAIRYESPYWRTVAAVTIQVVWRYRKKCLSRTDTSSSKPVLSSRTMQKRRRRADCDQSYSVSLNIDCN